MLFNAVVMNFPISTFFKILSIMQSVHYLATNLFLKVDSRCYTVKRFMLLSSQSQQRLESIFKRPVSIGCTTEILQDKLQERCYIMQWLENALQRCGNLCEKWNLILLRAMLLATKMLHDFMTARHVTRCNFTCNLCRNSALSSCLITFGPKERTRTIIAFVSQGRSQGVIILSW